MIYRFRLDAVNILVSSDNRCVGAVGVLVCAHDWSVENKPDNNNNKLYAWAPRGDRQHIARSVRIAKNRLFCKYYFLNTRGGATDTKAVRFNTDISTILFFLTRKLLIKDYT